MITKILIMFMLNSSSNSLSLRSHCLFVLYVFTCKLPHFFVIKQLSVYLFLILQCYCGKRRYLRWGFFLAFVVLQVDSPFNLPDLHNCVGPCERLISNLSQSITDFLQPFRRLFLFVFQLSDLRSYLLTELRKM